MANLKAVQELRAKIAARKAEREAEKNQKYAKMRLVAAKAPEKLEKHLAGLADKFASMAEGIENLRENLGLVRAAKQAPLKVRIATARNYGKTFKRIAEEAPEKLAEALAEAYNGLNDIAADIEMAAEQMGVDLESQPGVEQEVAKDIVEEAEMEGESPEHELMEKVEGDDDDDDEHMPGIENSKSDKGFRDFIDKEKSEEPEEEKEASGSDAWVTDRDDNGKPNAPVVAAAGESGLSQPDRVVGLRQMMEKNFKDTLHNNSKLNAQEVDALWVEFMQKYIQDNKAPLSTLASQRNKSAMSRKDYIIIADAVRSFRMPNQQREDLARHMSKYLASDNYNFSEGIFVDYVMGRGGRGGGKKFDGDAPNVPDTLFV